MAHSELTCPFCNASLTGMVRGSSAERLPCLRCGEPLPAALCEQLPSEPFPAANTAVPAATQAPGKTKTLLAVLTIMLVMAATAGVFAWNTQKFRRDNDYRTQKKTDPKQPMAAADVPILGLLPARCNVLAAVQVGELLKHPAARKLLEEPPLGSAIGSVQQWTGLKLGEIEQIVVGTEVKAKLPQLIVLVQTRQPYAQGKIAEALAPAQASKHLQKMLVRFPLQPVGEGLAWCHSERLLVFVLALDAATMDDLNSLPPRPRSGTEGFAEPLRTALAERLPTSSAVWLAGHFDEPSAVGDLLGFASAKNAALETLLQTKTFVVSLQPQENPTLTGHFRAGDAKSAERLQTLLESRRCPEALSYKVAGPPPDGEPWVTLQMRGDFGRWVASWSEIR